MIKNYFRVAFRSLLRNKSYAAINIVGLAVGVAACLLIFLVIRYELSFDTFHKKKDQIYQVVTTFTTPDGSYQSSGVPSPLPEAMRTAHPELKAVAAIFGADETLVSITDENDQVIKKFNEQRGVYYAEPGIFNILDFHWLAGDPATALKNPNTTVITQDAAERYFGDWKNAMGKSIKYLNKDVFKIAGVVKNMPDNSDFPFKVILSYKSFEEGRRTDWLSIMGNESCFLLLPEHTTVARVNAQLKALVLKNKAPEEAARAMHVLQPLSDYHFNDEIGNFASRTFNKTLITSLSLIALFLLVIACVNFINLATAQAVNRSKEIGVRKVLGSDRMQLVKQFMSETALITISAVLLATLIATITLPFLNNLMQITVHFDIFRTPEISWFLTGTTLVVTLLSGFYPALVLSGFNPITALKSKMTAKTVGGISLRRGLVVMQFVIAQVLIIGTLVVVNQMEYVRTASLGFDKNAIVNVPIPVNDSASRSKMDVLRQQLMQQPGIKNASFSYASPTDNYGWRSRFRFDGSPTKTPFAATLKWADDTYFTTYNLQIIAGTIYPQSDTTRGFVVNETLLKKLGIRHPEEALGKYLNFWEGEVNQPIVGVIKDFHAATLHAEIPPVVLGSRRSDYATVGIKLQGTQVKETLAAIEKLWNGVYPQYVYEYQFLDEKIARLYQQETQLAQLYKIFAGIAIFISCLGLYGLVAFMATQRVKEVGVRKVLGASVAHIVYLFSKEFTILIAVAFVIAAPLAWYFMHQWLHNFVFRANMGAGVFVLAVTGSIVIAWLTVGYLAVKAAMVNPVKSLRTE